MADGKRMRTVKLTVRTTQTKIYGDGAGQEPYSPPAPETADDPFGGQPEFPEDIEDAVIRKIEEAEREGLFTRPRYSPGYGDLPLGLQREISRILNMPKEIGVSLTEALLMTPSKSVTALVGVSDKPGECRSRGCEDCSASGNCPYRAAET